MQVNSRFVPCASVLAPMRVLTAAAPAQSPIAGKWHGGVSIGGAMASDNTRSTAFAANADAVRATTADRITLYILGNYAKAEMSGVGTTTANPFRLGGRYDDNVSERLFAFGGGEADTNRAGGVDLRWALNGGVGHRVIRTEQNSFDLVGGLGCSDTAFTDGTQRNGAGLLFGEEPSHKLGDSTSAKQRPIVYPGRSDVGTRATWDAGLAMAIIGGRTLNTGLSCRYAGTVAAGLKTSDTP